MYQNSEENKTVQNNTGRMQLIDSWKNYDSLQLDEPKFAFASLTKNPHTIGSRLLSKIFCLGEKFQVVKVPMRIGTEIKSSAF